MTCSPKSPNFLLFLSARVCVCLPGFLACSLVEMDVVVLDTSSPYFLYSVVWCGTVDMHDP